MNENIRKLLPYGLVLLSFGVFCLLMIIIFDAILMPSLIKEEDTIKVPDVTGKTLTEAEGTLTENDLKVAKVIEQNSIDVPEGTVISQDPKPGMDVKVGRAVYLTVRKGQSNSNVPNVTGLSQREARMNLMNAGLTVGNITYTSSELYGPDTVISQSIRGNTPASSGQPVDLIVSKGSETQVQVPNILNSDFNEVQSILQESGLVLGTVEKKDGGGTYLPNTVIGQKPQAGKLVPANTPVNIVVTK